MRVEYSRRFVKEFKKCPPLIQRQFRDKLVLFFKDKFHPLLNNHALSGELAGYRSLNVNGDWRVIFFEDDAEDVVSFVIIGTHSKLYR